MGIGSALSLIGGVAGPFLSFGSQLGTQLMADTTRTMFGLANLGDVQGTYAGMGDRLNRFRGNQLEKMQHMERDLLATQQAGAGDVAAGYRAGTDDVLAGYDRLMNTLMRGWSGTRGEIGNKYDALTGSVTGDRLTATDRANPQALQGYAGRYEAMRGELDRLSGQERDDLRRSYRSATNTEESRLSQQGLGGTSVTSSMRKGMLRDETDAMRRLSDSLLRERVSTLSGLSGDYLQAKAGLGQAGIAADQNMAMNQLSAQQNLGQNRLGAMMGREANLADLASQSSLNELNLLANSRQNQLGFLADIESQKLNQARDALNQRLALFNLHMPQGPGYPNLGDSFQSMTNNLTSWRAANRQPQEQPWLASGLMGMTGALGGGLLGNPSLGALFASS
jgi:hypothetical protein